MNEPDKGALAKVVPSGAAVPACEREAKRAWQQTRRTNLYCTHGRGSSVKHEAASMDKQLARSTMLHPLAPFIGLKLG